MITVTKEQLAEAFEKAYEDTARAYVSWPRFLRYTQEASKTNKEKTNG